MNKNATIKKKFLSALLTVIMALSLVPTPVFAAGEIAAEVNSGGTTTQYSDVIAAFSEAKDGDTVKLMKNAELSDSDNVIVKNKSITLELNGYTIPCVFVGWEDYNEETYEITATYEGNMTVKDSVGGGGITGEVDIISGALTVESGTIGTEDNSDTMAGIQLINGTVTLNGGIVWNIACEGGSGTFNITGGSVKCVSSVNPYYDSETGAEGEYIFNVTGGLHSGKWAASGVWNISGGTFGEIVFANPLTNSQNVFISGGTFEKISTFNDASGSPAQLRYLLKNGYSFYHGENGEYNEYQSPAATALSDVAVLAHTHKIENGICSECGEIFAFGVTASNGTFRGYYATIGEAFTAADAGDTVTLFTDITESSRAIYVSGGPYTLDLNGHKIDTSDILLVGDVGENNNDLNGYLTVKDSSENKTGYVRYLYLLSGEMTVENGSFHQIINFSTASVGKIIVKGGTADEVSRAGKDVKVEISGGTFSAVYDYVNQKPAELLAEGFAFANKNTGKIEDGYSYDGVSNVTVVPHTVHNTNGTNGACECGLLCYHNGTPERNASYFERAVCSLCHAEYGECLKDTTAPTGEVTIKERSGLKSLLNAVSFGLFFKNDITAEITGKDDSYTHEGFDKSKHEVKLEYFISDDVISEEALKTADFTEHTGPVSILKEGKYVVYACITDFAGNVSYISSNGFEIDKTAPAFDGMENGGHYAFCFEKTVTVVEKNIAEITLDGKAVTADENNGITVSGDSREHTITVTDSAGNKSTVYVTAYASHSFDEKTDVCTRCKNPAVAKILYPTAPAERFASAEEMRKAVSGTSYNNAMLLILKDIMLDGALYISGKELTFDLNGKSLNCGDVYINTQSVVTFVSSNGEGTLSADITLDSENAALTLGDGLGSIKNVHVKNGSLTVLSGRYGKIAVENGKNSVSLCGGSFENILSAKNPESFLGSGKKFFLEKTDGTFSLYGGFTNLDGSYEFSADSENKRVFVAEHCYKDGKCIDCGALLPVKITYGENTEYFEKLSEAVEKLNNEGGGRLEIRSNVTADKKNITVSSNIKFVLTKSELSGQKLTVKSGDVTFDASGFGVVSCPLYVTGGTVTVNSGNFSSATVMNRGVSLNVNGGVFTVLKATNSGRLNIYKGEIKSLKHLSKSADVKLYGGNYYNLSTPQNPEDLLAEGKNYYIPSKGTVAEEGDFTKDGIRYTFIGNSSKFLLVDGHRYKDNVCTACGYSRPINVKIRDDMQFFAEDFDDAVSTSEYFGAGTYEFFRSLERGENEITIARNSVTLALSGNSLSGGGIRVGRNISLTVPAGEGTLYCRLIVNGTARFEGGTFKGEISIEGGKAEIGGGEFYKITSTENPEQYLLDGYEFRLVTADGVKEATDVFTLENGVYKFDGGENSYLVAIKDHYYYDGVCVLCGEAEKPEKLTAETAANYGLGSEYAGFYAVKNYGDLLSWSKNIDGSCVLLGDILIKAEYRWAAPEAENIVFDGNGHTVTLYAKDGISGDYGLFKKLTNSTVRNLVLRGEISASVSGNFGAVGGNLSDTTVERVMSFMNIENRYSSFSTASGGIVGYYATGLNSNAKIENCAVYADVKGVVAGGIIGEARGSGDCTLSDCVYKGDVTKVNSVYPFVKSCGGAIVGSDRMVGASYYTNIYYKEKDGSAYYGKAEIAINASDVEEKSEESFRSGEVASLLPAFGQLSNTEGSYPIITDNDHYRAKKIDGAGYTVAQKGNVNGDETVDINDYQLAVNTALSKNNTDEYAKYDVNRDGKVNENDLKALSKTAVLTEREIVRFSELLSNKGEPLYDNWSSDINCDGVTDVLDCALLEKMIHAKNVEITAK